MVDEPLIFVEVALTPRDPSAIAPILDTARTPLAPESARTAVFLFHLQLPDRARGVSFGNFLIKQVWRKSPANSPI